MWGEVNKYVKTYVWKENTEKLERQIIKRKPESCENE